MTEDEFKKIADIRSKMLIAYNCGMDESVIDMMNERIAEIELASSERDIFENMPETGCVIDTSVDTKINAIPEKIKQTRTRRRRKI